MPEGLRRDPNSQVGRAEGGLGESKLAITLKGRFRGLGGLIPGSFLVLNKLVPYILAASEFFFR